ncbi:MAG TPA: NAD(+)/NADH kinase, partial [Methanoregulaceae archaeon]|nr:NAD(+)/NADH kinase [Methanoregulaceae archaeon]
FLTDLEPEEAPAFLDRISPDISCESRMRITFSLDGHLLGTALNEAVIVTSRPAKMLRFSISIDGNPSDQFRADGMIVATPTGSTAYAMSAGGPLVDPRVEGFLLVPLAPYMLSSRPHLISSHRDVELALESPKPAHMVLDGQVQFEIDGEARIRVERAVEPALFVNTGRNFFGKVEQKLRRL